MTTSTVVSMLTVLGLGGIVAAHRAARRYLQGSAWVLVREDGHHARYEENRITGKRRFNGPLNYRPTEVRWLAGGAFYTPEEWQEINRLTTLVTFRKGDTFNIEHKQALHRLYVLKHPTQEEY